MRRWSITFALALAVVCSCLTVLECVRLSDQLDYNQALNNPDLFEGQSELEPDQLLIRAWHLHQQGKTQQALAMYRSILQSDTELSSNHWQQVQETALYNIGVINLKLAAASWNEMGVWAYSEVIVPLNQAKQAFKTVLRHNPGHWNARYNLDYALRITPPPKEREKQGMTESRSSVHAVLPGQPAGGP